MAATPTDAEVLVIRPDLQDTIDAIGNSKTIADYSARALAQVKRDLEDKRGILWAQVYDETGGAYLDNADATGRNADRIKNLVALLAVCYVYQDYAITTEGGNWWELSQAFRSDYDTSLDAAKLDVDADEDGSIGEDEESASGQSFLVR